MNEKEKIKVIDKIRKVVALAEGSDKDGEIANAMRMARKLMAQHSLTMDDIKEEPQFGKIQISSCSARWKRMLSGQLALFFGLASCYDKGNKIVEVYGGLEQLDPFQLCFDMAIDDILKHSKKLGGFTTSFRVSMVVGLTSVLKTIERIDHADTAIVRVKGSKASGYMQSQVKTITTPRRQWKYSRSQDGYEKGVKIGKKIKGDPQN